MINYDNWFEYITVLDLCTNLRCNLYILFAIVSKANPMKELAEKVDWS